MTKLTLFESLLHVYDERVRTPVLSRSLPVASMPGWKVGIRHIALRWLARALYPGTREHLVADPLMRLLWWHVPGGRRAPSNWLYAKTAGMRSHPRWEAMQRKRTQQTLAAIFAQHDASMRGLDHSQWANREPIWSPREKAEA